MDILKDLQNMIDRSSTFAKRNQIKFRGNKRDFGNVYIIPEIELLAFQDKLGEYVESRKVIVQEPKKSKKERGQRATAAADESFYFPLGRS